MYVPSVIDVGPAVSEPFDFENVDERTDGRTFDRFCQPNVTTLRSAYGMSRPSVVCSVVAP